MRSRQPNTTAAGEPADLKAKLLQTQKLIAASLDIICSFDASGNFVFVSAACTPVLGYLPEEMSGRFYLDFVAPEDVSATAETSAKIKAGSPAAYFENHYIHKKGHYVPLQWSARWDEEAGLYFGVARDARKQKTAEARVKSQEQKYYRAYKLARIGWWEVDGETHQAICSDELFEIYGLPKTPNRQMSLETYLSLIPDEEKEKVLQEHILMFHKNNYQYEHRIIKPDGKEIFVIHEVEAIRNAAGKVTKVHGTTKDITEQKAAQKALEASEKKAAQTAGSLYEILERLGDGFIAMDRNFTITYWNRTVEELIGLKRSEAVGRNLWELYPEAVDSVFYTEYNKALSQNIPVNFEALFPALNMWIEVSAYPSENQLSVFFKNNNEKRKRKEALKQSNERFELAAKATSDAIWDWDVTSGTVYFNHNFNHIFGYPATVQIEAGWAQNIHPEDRERVAAKMAQAHLDLHAYHWEDEYRFCRANGTIAHVHDRGTIVRDADGKAVRMIGAMSDITARKEAAEAINLSEQRYKLLFYESPKPKWVFNGITYQIVEANNAALNLYGYSRKEFLKLTIPQLRQPDDVTPFYNMMNNGYTDEKPSAHLITRHVKSDGTVFNIELMSHRIHLPSGVHFMVEGNDMTEVENLQRMITEEKIAAQKEVMKAIIYTQEKERSDIGKELHDNVNQILTTAKLYIENIGYFPDQREVFIEKSASLVQKSITEIRALSKALVTPVMNDLGFKETVQELVDQFNELAPFAIRFTFKAGVQKIEKGVQLTIYRIIQEQLNNIVKHARATNVTVRVIIKNAQLHMCVADDGIGFDASKKSAGLGLSNIYNRAGAYKGQVKLKAAPGKGCKLQVVFPL